MLVVAVHFDDDQVRRSVQASLSRHVHVVVCRTTKALRVVLNRLPVAAVIVGLRDFAGRSTAPGVRELRSRTTNLVIIGVVRVDAGDLRELAPVAAAGLSDVLCVDLEVAWEVVRPWLGRTGIDSAIEDVLGALAGRVPRAVWPLIEFGVRHAAYGPTVQQAAAALGVDRKTLARWSRAGALAPSSLLNWTRLLVAARQLELLSRSVERVARDLGFPSVMAFRRVLRRHSGLRPSEVRRRGGLPVLLTAFLRANDTWPARIPNPSDC